MRDREGIRRGVRRRARGSARQSTSTKGLGGCPQVAGSSRKQQTASAVAGGRKRGKRRGRGSIRRDGRGRGTSCALQRLNYGLWYASPNELGYASTNLRAYSTARTGRVATIGCFHDQAQPLSLHPSLLNNAIRRAALAEHLANVRCKCLTGLFKRRKMSTFIVLRLDMRVP